MLFQKKFNFVKQFKDYGFDKNVAFKLDGIRFTVKSQKLTWEKDGWKYYLFWDTKFMDDGMFRGIGNIVESLTLSLVNKKDFDEMDGFRPYLAEVAPKVYLDSKAEDPQVTSELQSYIQEVMNSYVVALNHFENNEENKVKQGLDNLLK